MAIFDGLKNGYSSYFMYQPSQGLNPQLLAYAMRGDYGRGSGLPSLGSGGGSSSTKKEDSISGPYLQRLMYQDEKEKVDMQEYVLRRRAVEALQNRGFESPMEIPEVREYVNSKQAFNMMRDRMSINANWIEENNEIFANARNDYKALRGRPAVGKTDMPGLESGSHVPGSRDNRIFAWRWQIGSDGKPTGEKEIVNAYNVEYDEKGNVKSRKLNIYDAKKNPGGAMGVLDNQQFLDWQERNLGYDSKGFAMRPVLPAMYTPGSLDKWLKDLYLSVVNNTESFVSFQNIMPATEKSPQSRGVPVGEVGDYKVKETSNLSNLRRFVAHSFNTISDQNLIDEATSDFAAAAFSGMKIPVFDNGGNIVVEKDGNMKMQDVADADLNDFLTAKASGLVNSGSIRYDIDIDTRPKGAGENDEIDQMSAWRTVLNPFVPVRFGNMVKSTYYDFGVMPDKFTKEDGGTWPVFLLDVDSRITEPLDRFMKGGSDSPKPMLANGISLFRNGLVTPVSTIVDLDKAQNEIYFIGHTGKLSYSPMYQKSDNGKLSYTLNFGDEKKTLVEMTNHLGVQVAMKGSDLIKIVDLPIGDEKATKQVLKDNYKDQRRSDVPLNLRNISRQIESEIENDKRTILNEQEIIDLLKKKENWQNDESIKRQIKRRENNISNINSSIAKNESLIKEKYKEEGFDYINESGPSVGISPESDFIIKGADDERRKLTYMQRYGSSDPGAIGSKYIQKVVMDNNGFFNAVPNDKKIEDDAYYVVSLYYQVPETLPLDVGATDENTKAFFRAQILEGEEFKYMPRNFDQEALTRRNKIQSSNYK